MSDYTQKVPCTFEETEFTADVSYSFSKGSPAVMYQRNGDPGWPAEPAEIEITGIEVDGQAVPKFVYDAISQSDRVLTWLYEHHEDTSEDDRADYEYDRRRDEKMERGA